MEKQPFEYHFEWDSVKAGANYKKHGISFERAAAVFHDPRALSLFDNEHSLSEERWITLGLDQAGVLVVVSHTFHIEDEHNRAQVRIISARKAMKKEIQNYEEG